MVAAMKIVLLGNTLNPIKKEGLITGYAMASDDLMYSFIKYSSAEKIYCTYEPMQYQIERLEEFANKKCEFINEYDLLFYGIKNMPDVNLLCSVKEDALPLLYFRESMKKKIPITFILHEIAEQHLIVDFFYYMLYMPFREYDAIICTSEAVRKTVEKIFLRLEQTLPHAKRRIRLEKAALGIDTDYFRPLDKMKCRRRNGIPEDAFVIVWFGRFSDIFKADLHVLLHTFKKLLDANPKKKLFLLLAGSEDNGFRYSEMLKKDLLALNIDANTKLMFHHEISNRAEIYNAADVFTSPIDNILETFGLTPLEAMACGIPQVVSDWDGYRDTVENEKTGFLIKTFWSDCMDVISKSDYLPLNRNNRRLIHKILSVRSTAIDCGEYFDKLHLLVNDDALREKMSKESRKRAVEKFCLQCSVRTMEKIWNQLIDIAKNTNTEFSEELPVVDYCKDFESYPTRFVEDYYVFRLTEFGKHADYDTLPFHPLFLACIDESKLPVKILEYIRQTGKMTIKELEEIFPDYTIFQIRRSVMFLFKYDLVFLSN